MKTSACRAQAAAGRSNRSPEDIRRERLDAARVRVEMAGGLRLRKFIEDFGNLPVPEVSGKQPAVRW